MRKNRTNVFFAIIAILIVVELFGVGYYQYLRTTRAASTVPILSNIQSTGSPNNSLTNLTGEHEEIANNRQIWAPIWWTLQKGESPPPWHLYTLPATSRDLGPAETIPLLPLSGSCDWTFPTHGVYGVRLNEAFIVNHLIDVASSFPSESDPVAFMVNSNRNSFGDIPYGRFLVLQGFARNATPISDKGCDHCGSAESPSLAGHVDIVRNGVHEPALVNGSVDVAPIEAVTKWALFPIRDGEQKFTLLYCSSHNPQTITLDFTSSAVQTIRGNFSFEWGLFLNNK